MQEAERSAVDQAGRIPAFVEASMPAPKSGRGDVTVTAVFDDGSERTLATWSDIVEPTDRLLLSRSPDGTRAAVALGRFVRTLSAIDGSVIARKPIGHSEPTLIFGWPEQGAVVVRDAEARSGPDLPIGHGWISRVNGSTTVLLRDGLEPIRVGGADETENVAWPPIVSRDGVLIRRADWVDTGTPPPSDEPGQPGPIDPSFVTGDGAVSTIPVHLAVSPICVLPDGRYLLPGASETWRDAGDEPLHAFDRKGRVGPWIVGGAAPRAQTIVAALAPDLLPAAAPDLPDAAAWTDDAGPWIHAGVVRQDGTGVLLLLADADWPPSAYAPSACTWLVAEIAFADGALRLVARGRRAEGEGLAIAL